MIKLVLDPGHGGKDPGSAGNGLLEKNVNLDLCGRVAARLRDYEAEVVLTRSGDVDVSLDARSDMANTLAADFFCSLHSNAGGGTGFESYIHTTAGERTEVLRAAVHDAVAAYLATIPLRDRGKMKANFAVLRETVMPAVLLENLFIDNPADAARLKDSAFLEGLAGAIAGGLVSALAIPLKPRPEPAQTPVKVEAAAEPAQARLRLAAVNPKAPDYVNIYAALEKKYGIRWDAVFAQSCKETAYWKFGGAVKPEQNNFAGLAAFGGSPGASFPTPEEGIEAQFQHWHAYYYGGDLPPGTKVLDPRRDAVIHSGSAGALSSVEDLGGRWAPATDYGLNIVNHYLKPILETKVPPPACDPGR